MPIIQYPGATIQTHLKGRNVFYEDSTIPVHRSVLHDKGLSLKAKGLHCYLRSLPEEWVISVVDLGNRLKEGKDAVAAGLKELVDHGNVLREQNRGHRGVFMGYHYVVLPETQMEWVKSMERKPISELTDSELSTVTGKPVYRQ